MGEMCLYLSRVSLLVVGSTNKLPMSIFLALFKTKEQFLFTDKLAKTDTSTELLVAAMWKGASRAADATIADVVPTWH